MDPRPIGIFDSGVGGLTVLAHVRAALPGEDLIYLGDTARVPYGSRGADTIRRYARNVVAHLVDQGCKAIVVACNTASAWAIDDLRARFSVPIIDVIEPVARAVAQSGARSVAVLATRGTVSSGAYSRALQRLAPATRIEAIACPLFVPLAEEGLTDGAIPRSVAELYLTPAAAGGAWDAVILGCTHYPLLSRTIGQVVEAAARAPVPLHDSGRHTARELVRVLTEFDLANDSNPSGSLRIMVTDDPAALGSIAGRFLGHDPGPIEHVDIGTAAT